MARNKHVENSDSLRLRTLLPDKDTLRNMLKHTRKNTTFCTCLASTKTILIKNKPDTDTVYKICQTVKIPLIQGILSTSCDCQSLVVSDDGFLVVSAVNLLPQKLQLIVCSFGHLKQYIWQTLRPISPQKKSPATYKRMDLSESRVPLNPLFDDPFSTVYIAGGLPICLPHVQTSPQKQHHKDRFPVMFPLIFSWFSH